MLLSKAQNNTPIRRQELRLGISNGFDLKNIGFRRRFRRGWRGWPRRSSKTRNTLPANPGKPRTVYEAFDRHNSLSQPCSLDISTPLSHISKNTCRSLARAKISFSSPRLSHSPERILLPFIRGGGRGRLIWVDRLPQQQNFLRGIAWKIDCRGDCYTFPSRCRSRVFNF
ncbi:hypothetical protein CDAR_564971 [Caerostris darwini]|uniref:Uncharacterized protein n=1 Tax=Caerostris darwini TaxID=1538125 RepID=A0AAV4URP4_9ARAC|nr:hypothetical protein CDAR_564971 [Caerostris darwini]